MNRRFLGATLLRLTLALSLLAAVGIADQERHPLEVGDTSSPRATLETFLGTMHEMYEMTEVDGRSPEVLAKIATRLRRVLSCLDQSELPPAVRESRAKEALLSLKEVLDRIELPAASEVPGAEEVARDDLTRWTIPHTEISLVRMTEGPQEGSFLFSSATVERAVNFLEIVEERAYVERETTTPGFYLRFVSEPGWMISSDWIPTWAHSRWWGQAIWQWFGLFVTLGLALFLMGLIYAVGLKRAKTLKSNLARYVITLGFPIAALSIPLATRYFVTQQLQIHGDISSAISFSLHAVFLFTLVILTVSVSNRIAEVIIATPWVAPAGLDAQLTRLICRVLGIVAAVVVVLEGAQKLGFSLTTLLAGAGVSGLALALAAQDSLRNILGSMTIMLDKPFRVGERIIAKGYDGVVEDIGLRSTKIRLLTGHQASVPNEELARSEVENVSRRPHVRHSSTIEVPSDTPPAKLERALEILRTLLTDHEGMQPALPPRIYLKGASDGVVRIAVMYWYHPPEYWDFLAFGERTMLEASRQFEREGIEFASPSMTLRPPS